MFVRQRDELRPSFPIQNPSGKSQIASPHWMLGAQRLALTFPQDQQACKIEVYVSYSMLGTSLSAALKSRQVLQNFLSSYLRFADEVIDELRQNAPAKLKTFQALRTRAERNLHSLPNRVKVDSIEDAQKVESLVSAMREYMQAAEYLDDKAAMLTNVVRHLTSVLQQLQLLKPAEEDKSFTLPATQPGSYSHIGFCSPFAASELSWGKKEAVPQGHQGLPNSAENRHLLFSTFDLAHGQSFGTESIQSWVDVQHAFNASSEPNVKSRSAVSPEDSEVDRRPKLAAA